MLDALICEAIRGQQLLMYEYGGLIRVVEPHLLGENAAGNALLSGWLRPGYSRSDPHGGWRTWRVDRIGSAQALDQRFDAPRPGYNPGDSRMARVVCALPGVPGSHPATAAGVPPDPAPDDQPPDAVDPDAVDPERLAGPDVDTGAG